MLSSGVVSCARVRSCRDWSRVVSSGFLEGSQRDWRARFAPRTGAPSCLLEPVLPASRTARLAPDRTPLAVQLMRARQCEAMISQARKSKWRRVLVDLYGRRRAARMLGEREPVFEHTSDNERLAMWRWKGLGVSDRQIARHLRRDHHTVHRQLEPDRGVDLALSLALAGRRLDAREMVLRLGSPEGLAEQVESCLQNVAGYIRFEREREAARILRRAQKRRTA